MSYRGKRVVGIIPSRIGSTRLLRKPLADICGLPMIVHVAQRAALSEVLDEVIVATDCQEIADAVRSHGRQAVLTASHYTTGIERVAEVARGRDEDIVVLINGDEAAFDPAHIRSSVEALMNSDAPTALLAAWVDSPGDESEFKVAVNLRGEAMYFSRSAIPSPARSDGHKYLKAYHIISFRREFLREYAGLSKTPFEAIEGHDHLRMLEHGIKVQVGIVEHGSTSVDTQADLEFVRRQMADDPHYPKYRDIPRKA